MFSKRIKLIIVVGVVGIVAALFLMNKEKEHSIAQVVFHKKNKKQWTVLRLKDDMSLKELARLTHQTPERLLEWNPDLRKKRPYAGMGIGLWLTPEEATRYADKSFLISAEHKAHGNQIEKVISYRIRENDSITGIVKRFHSDILLLTKMNDPSKLSVMMPGTVIKVPIINRESHKIRHKKAVKGTFIYRVKQADTGWKLARRFHTTLKLLKKLNPGTDINHLQPGDELLIPSTRKITKNRSH